MKLSTFVLGAAASFMLASAAVAETTIYPPQAPAENAAPADSSQPAEAADAEKIRKEQEEKAAKEKDAAGNPMPTTEPADSKG